MRLVGMRGKKLGRRVGERAARVLPLVPFLGADVAEEMLHRCVVAGEELAIEMPRIPLQQDATNIEHDDAAPARRGVRRLHARGAAGRRSLAAATPPTLRRLRRRSSPDPRARC